MEDTWFFAKKRGAWHALGWMAIQSKSELEFILQDAKLHLEQLMFNTEDRQVHATHRQITNLAFRLKRDQPITKMDLQLLSRTLDLFRDAASPVIMDRLYDVLDYLEREYEKSGSTE